MKIQPIDSSYTPEEPIRTEPVKPVLKSRLKRLLERQFPNVRRSSAAVPPEKVSLEEPRLNKDGSGEFEPSSVCLAKMVQNFIEENNEKQAAAPIRCNRNRCNCFNGNSNETSEDELDAYGGFGFGDSNFPSSAEAYEILKSLVPCASICERNLLADTARVVEKNKICKRKDGFCRKIVTDALLALGYDASICKSRWEKSSSFPAGEYEYIDVIVEGERLLIDIDFRSEFEIARSTKTYRTILQALPYIFVGKTDRLQRIITIVSEAAEQSLKKKGMHFPPWRKADYVKAKWLSSYTRISPSPTPTPTPTPTRPAILTLTDDSHETLSRLSESKLEKNSVDETEFDGGESVFVLSDGSAEEEKMKMTVEKDWMPPAIKPKIPLQIGVKIGSGLASVMGDKP